MASRYHATNQPAQRKELQPEGRFPGVLICALAAQNREGTITTGSELLRKAFNRSLGPARTRSDRRNAKLSTMRHRSVGASQSLPPNASRMYPSRKMVSLIPSLALSSGHMETQMDTKMDTNGHHFVSNDGPARIQIREGLRAIASGAEVAG
jgi:hypothetical protein